MGLYTFDKHMLYFNSFHIFSTASIMYHKDVFIFCQDHVSSLDRAVSFWSWVSRWIGWSVSSLGLSRLIGRSVSGHGWSVSGSWLSHWIGRSVCGHGRSVSGPRVTNYLGLSLSGVHVYALVSSNVRVER